MSKGSWSVIAAALLAGGILGSGIGRGADEPAAAEVDTELRAAIAAHEAHFFAAMERGDVEAMLEVYTEDAIALPPNAPLVRGRAALRAFWAGYLRDVTSQVDHETVVMERRGDLLYEVSTYRQRLRWKDGRVTEDQGKWMTIKKLQPDGGWKTHAGAWSSDR